MTTTILINDVVEQNRIRKDLGGIDKLADSIKRFGIIQPIVLAEVDSLSETYIYLIAGGRRLNAMKRLGIKELRHGIEFIWRGEENEIQRRAVELEENLQRKELTWQETLEGKQKLLDLMQVIYGPAKAGKPTSIPSPQPGFGINKLSSMLGESLATTSQDLQLARMIKTLPSLATLKNKSEAMTQLKILGAVVGMQQNAAPAQVGDEKPKFWTLIEEDFRGSVDIPAMQVASDSVDLIWTDLPYGADVNQMSGMSATLATFDDSDASARSLLTDIAKESYRVLRDNRYAVFCFGFTLYTDLVTALENAGFKVNPVPFIWAKNSKSGENPNTRYCNSYEPLLVATKGSPVFMRPGKPNVLQIPVVQAKLQAVQKPVGLVKEFILDMTGEGATVVDWCCGTGTTGVACHELKRHAILFERDPSMATIAKARLGELK